MGWSTNRLAAAATAVGGLALPLLLGVAAGGQEAEAPPGDGEATEAVEEVMEEPERFTGSPLEQYTSMLKQIDAIRVYNDQMRSLIGSQESELESLTAQVGRVGLVARSVTPLMLKMVKALEEFVELDIPFQIEDRKKKVAELRETMNKADVSEAEKFRRIMEAYQIENEYGRTIDAYRSTLNVEGKEITVDFLRFGRIALVYQSLDESQTGAWNQNSRSWVPLDSSFRSAIRQGLRIARKQAAPDLVRLPLPAAQRGGAS